MTAVTGRSPRLVLASSRQRGGRRGGGERVDDDPAVGAGDEGDVGDVVAPALPDAVGHLEQPVHRVEPTLTPQARVHRRRRLLLVAQEVVLGDVPRGAQRPVERSRGMGGHQPAGGPLPVAVVVEAERGTDRLVGGGGVHRGGLGITGRRHGPQYRGRAVGSTAAWWSAPAAVSFGPVPEPADESDRIGDRGGRRGAPDRSDPKPATAALGGGPPGNGSSQSAGPASVSRSSWARRSWQG